MEGEATGLSWLESTKTRGMSLGLKTTNNALNRLVDNGHRPFTVHVAGSNGKGTLCATVAASLNLIGTSTLMFSSPHLVRVEERFRIDGVPVTGLALNEALSEVKTVDKTMGGVLTFFESTFLIAMHLARHHQVDVLVLETGLGGRLDATRCAPADVAVITSLALEHTEVLGATLEAIANEKAGIARPGRPFIVRTPRQASVRDRIVTAAQNAGQTDLGETSTPALLEWVNVPEEDTYGEEAKRLCRVLWPHLPHNGQPMPSLTALHWPARMQSISSRRSDLPSWLLEGAHNPSGMRKAVAELVQRPFVSEPWVLLFGSSPQPDLHAMVEPLVGLMKDHPPIEVIVSEPQGGRYPAVPCEEWMDVIRPLVTCPVTCMAVPSEAVSYCQQTYGDSTTVLSTGSLYMQGNVLLALDAATDEHLSVRAKA